MLGTSKMSACPVLFLHRFLTKFNAVPVKVLADAPADHADYVAIKEMLDGFKNSCPDEVETESFEKASHALFDTRRGKFQYMLDSFRVFLKQGVQGPDNNLDEYPELDARLEKAKAKLEAYRYSSAEITLEDCMTDTTGDWEYYSEVTQRKHDLFKAWWIVLVLKNIRAHKGYLDTLGIDVNYSNFFEFVRDCYTLDNVDMEY